MIEKFKAWFVNKVNFCEGYFYKQFDSDGNPVEKPENKTYNWFYKYWLWPCKQTDCLCCNSVRGLIYGLILGYIIGSFV